MLSDEFSDDDPCVILELAKENKNLKKLTNNQDFRDKISNNLGLPFSKSLKELCDYNKISTPKLLEISAKVGDLRVVQSCLSKGVTNLNAAMRESSREGHIKIVQLLLDNGADPNHGIMPAASGGYINIIKLLFEEYNNIHPNIAKGGLSNAISNNHTDIAIFLLDNGIKPGSDNLYAASQNGNTDIGYKLLEKGVTNYHYSFVTATKYKHFNFVKLLYDAFPNMSVITLNSALSLAVENNDIKMMIYLINRGADSFNQGMYAAAQTGNIKLVKYFINLGATYYDYAFLQAASAGHYNIVKLFLDMGIDNLDLDKAQELGRKYDNIVRLIEQYK